MKSSIDFLDKFKQDELKDILDIVLSSWKNSISAEMIIVFWDYINNNYFENIIKEWDQRVIYKQVINILIITKKPTQEKNLRLSREITSKIKNFKNINSPINILIEDIFSFNEWIKEWRYFYLDIINSGIILHDSHKCKIHSRKTLTLSEIKEIQKDDFESWFEIAEEFFIDYKNAFARNSFKIAIFYLHQSVESFITCYLLVKTWYKPKTHDLEILYSNLKTHSKRFNKFFDLTQENYYFDLLKWSYINSRYKKNYKVQKEDLVFIEEKVLFLKDIVKKLCLKELTKNIWNQEKN